MNLAASSRLRASAPRGLTLVEVLAATVLLALLTATCTPIVARAMSNLQPRATLVDGEVFGTLAEAADEFLADPERFGLEESTRLDEIDRFEFSWTPSTLESPSQQAIMVRIKRLASGAGSGEYQSAWLCFEANKARTIRWVDVPPNTTSGGARIRGTEDRS